MAAKKVIFVEKLKSKGEWLFRAAGIRLFFFEFHPGIEQKPIKIEPAVLYQILNVHTEKHTITTKSPSIFWLPR